MINQRELNALIAALNDQGFTVRITRRGHYFVTKNGVPVTTFSGTPSDHRSIRNGLAALKRAGFRPP